MKQHYQSKIELLQSALQKNQLDYAIILNYVDIYYFTGTIHANLLLVPAAGEPVVFTRRVTERTASETEYGKPVTFGSYKEIQNYLPKKGGKAGFLFDATPVNLFQKVSADLGLSLFDTADITLILKTIKMKKNDFEIARIKKAGQIVANAYNAVTKAVKPGITEAEVAALVEYQLKVHGHIGENRFRGYNQIGLLTYVLSGSTINDAAIHDTPYGGLGTSKAIGVGASNKKIQKGEPFVIDTVGSFEGYHNDNTRTYIFGKAPDKIRDSFKQLLEIYRYTIDLMKPGAICEDIYQKTLAKANSMGLADNFMGLGKNRVPFIAHGIGIQVDEFPVIAKNFKTALEEGMTLAFEPKLFDKDFGGVGIESTFLITKNGAENLSVLPETLTELE